MNKKPKLKSWQRCDELVEGLKKYGVHELGKCDLLGESGKCTCGLSDLINDE